MIAFRFAFGWSSHRSGANQESLAVDPARRPNIVLTVLDDVGFADVSYHTSDFSTPRIAELAASGVRLEGHYMELVCSPSRAALMSGRYPFRTGMQHINTIQLGSVAHIPHTSPSLAEALGSAGYRCHAIGKWHVGSASASDTPIGRGFSSFRGYYGAEVNYTSKESGENNRGFDFWNDEMPSWSDNTSYSSDAYSEQLRRVLTKHRIENAKRPAGTERPLFLYYAHQLVHFPLGVPPRPVPPSCKALISTPTRKVLCTMMVELDRLVGETVDLLHETQLWTNTLMWVLSDNGGNVEFTGPVHSRKSGSDLGTFPYSGSSNFPLRAGTSIASPYPSLSVSCVY